MRITGYADALSVAAGGRLTFRVSSETPDFDVDLVRLIHGDPNPEGPGFKATIVPSNIDGAHVGERQPIRSGSCAVAGDPVVLRGFPEVSFACWLYPTSATQEAQTIVARGTQGLCLWLERGGHLTLSVGGQIVARLAEPLETHAWYFVCVRSDQSGGLDLWCAASIAWPGQTGVREGAGMTSHPIWPDGLLMVAAQPADDGYRGHFNGKIENPALFNRRIDDAERLALFAGGKPTELAGCVLAWDFGQHQHTTQVVDCSASAHHGALVSLPTRAVTSHAWSGDEEDFRRAPDQYAAIHFHDDDLDDAAWAPSFTLEIPPDLPSGVYAAHLMSDLGEDHVPFVVTPPPGQATAKALLLLPTMTYMAYGDEAIANRPDMRAMMEVAGMTGDVAYPAQPEDRYIVSNHLLSCYDIHSDGSGVCFSSRLRPLLNMRPRYRMPLHGMAVRPGGAPHLLAADLYIVDWLDACGFAFDVATDEDLDDQGIDLLNRYDVVLTGSHPEYCTGRMFDALEAYCHTGGRLMYLGGNGFFCVTSRTERGHAIETRRSRTVRAWTSAPGEERHATTGEAGGPWTNRNRLARRLTGVGTTAVGFTSGRGYERTPAAADPRYAWVFDGVEDGDIGAYPNLIYGDGAAGWEIDRADFASGTPPSAVVLATARLKDGSYQRIVDELEAAGEHAGGLMSPEVRADMTLVEHPNGGRAFSVGSCMWAGALSYNGYNNAVSRVTANVLRAFIDGRADPTDLPNA